MENLSVSVKVQPEYEVLIGKGLINYVGSLIQNIRPRGACAVITDTNVEKLYLNTVLDSLKAAGFTPAAYAFPAGEEHKTMETLTGILDFMSEIPLTRSDFVVALGGGVTGDMAGFAAGVYMRGIPFIQIPTTFLAAVDSSVGGKTAVDLKTGKNLAGLFHQPSLVITDIDAFKTLTPENYACGSAESIKMGVISDPELFRIFECENPAEYESEIVKRAVQAKADVVMRDEKETGDRKLLNLGHTYGHAVEKLSNFTLPHGHAVAIGLAMAARAAEKMGDMDADTRDRMIKTLEKNNLPTACGFSAKEIYLSSLNDKKMAGKNLSIIVPKKIGQCEIRKIPASEFEKFIELGLK
ncbi:MAG: 3-dehydroquinate synthase [Clostridia bacterium]|nr:3-dehydroquinate synthase [Clostridia bacterium]